jgi:hypothetical protein
MSKEQSILWRRLDLPGHEACRLVTLDYGWDVAGTAVFEYETQVCQLQYSINCDQKWMTRSAVVRGWVGSRDINVEIARDESGRWQLNHREAPEVEGCSDIDLNFSPSTNLLPIRRLRLNVNEEAKVRAAWLRFPSFKLELLEQVYRRTGASTYRYESAGGKFVVDLQVDEFGWVTRYPGFWQAEELNDSLLHSSTN